jgi:hypothetical protein
MPTYLIDVAGVRKGADRFDLGPILLCLVLREQRREFPARLDDIFRVESVEYSITSYHDEVMLTFIQFE